MTTNDKRPVRDEGEPYRERPYHAGGPQGELSARKTALMNTGSTGFLPGRPGSLERAGHVHEAAPPPPTAGDELEPGPRPHPRDIPVHSYPTHTGTIVRHLDGSSRIYRDRPALLEEMNHPSTHPDDRKAIQDEITYRDAIHNHKYW